MKDKILVFVIGLLIGAVVTATGFVIFEKVNNNQMPNEVRMQMFERPEDFKNDGNRPEIPTKNNNTKSL